MHARMKALIKRGLARSGVRIQRAPLGKPNPIHLWDDDDDFNDLMKEIIGYTLVDKVRCFMIYQCAKQITGLSGDVAEVGVYKGGTTRLLAKVFESENKMIHSFDTFSGMPKPDNGKDLHREGDFGDVSLKGVESYLHDCENVLFYQGLFPITGKPVRNITFCLVHVDVDIYRSVMDCCEFFYPRMQKSGIMLFDDYGFLSCPGAKMAVDSFFLDKLESPCYLPTGQCIVIRL